MSLKTMLSRYGWEEAGFSECGELDQWKWKEELLRREQREKRE